MGFLFVVLYPVCSSVLPSAPPRPPPLFLTQLCHTPTLSHTIFHTQLCHTTLSHTTLHIQLLSYRSSASTISFVLSAFSVLLQPLFVIIGRILTCGVIRSFNFWTFFACSMLSSKHLIRLHDLSNQHQQQQKNDNKKNHGKQYRLAYIC